MKVIVITKPEYFEGEAEQIASLLLNGKDGWSVDWVHVRKPGTAQEQMVALLEAVPQSLRSRLVLHDCHELAERYGVHGVHLNGRNPRPPVGWAGSVSRSCHSIAEVREWSQRCDYVSLSPIFDSISKQGYHSAFSREDIADAVRQGYIYNKVYALGGVTFAKLRDVEAMGFGGAMILGDAWRNS